MVISPASPALLEIHGTADPSIPIALAEITAAELKSKGAPHWLVEIPVSATTPSFNHHSMFRIFGNDSFQSDHDHHHHRSRAHCSLLRSRSFCRGAFTNHMPNCGIALWASNSRFHLVLSIYILLHRSSSARLCMITQPNSLHVRCMTDYTNFSGQSYRVLAPCMPLKH